jgi:segregation and condensation protein A
LKQEAFEIDLPQFHGPFDLLLFFIERDELDIYDIPIATITNDFLEYIHQMEKLNIDLASEFILVASSLMRIKAKMLLPRREVDESGAEIDPREELVNRLIEYKKFKALSEELQQMEQDRSLLEKRGYANKEIQSIQQVYASEQELFSLNLYQLLKAFHKVVERQEAREKEIKMHQVVRYPYSIGGEKAKILERFDKNLQCGFNEIFAVCDSRVHAIFRFLGMLELIQEGQLNLQTGIHFNNFVITLVKNQLRAA